MLEDHDETAPTTLLTEPKDGVPEVVADPQSLRETITAFATGTGPIAIDAERASGFRYLSRAYLLQLRRTGAGTALIDPIAFGDLSALNEAIAGQEWILHAASQDLPCLGEIGMRPQQLFDTELAARLCGFERVGLAALTERLLGISLEKHHSAADWSTRPLPSDWLNYAALDVELLIDLRDILDSELREQGKREWAEEEFAAAATAPPPTPRKEPWRRTSGIHRVRGTQALARVRELWLLRDEIARQLDKAPSKIIPDPAIADAAIADPSDMSALFTIPGFQRRHGRANAKRWLEALDKARHTPESELPTLAPHTDGPPATHRWASRDPKAAERLKAARAVVATLSEQHNIPAENLLAPAAVRALAWQPPKRVSATSVADALKRNGARDWQVQLTHLSLAKALG